MEVDNQPQEGYQFDNDDFVQTTTISSESATMMSTEDSSLSNTTIIGLAKQAKTKPIRKAKAPKVT